MLLEVPTKRDAINLINSWSAAIVAEPTPRSKE